MISVRLIISITKIHKIGSKLIDFLLVFPQADLKEDIWMKLPICFQVDGQTQEDYDRYYVLKLKKSIYGLKKSSLNWYEKLNTALKAIEFKASNIDTYLYMGNIMIILTYVDYCIIFGPSMSKIYGIIQ